MKFWQIVFLVLLVTIIGVGITIWQPWKISTKNISVTGEGKVKDTPDVARIYGGFEARKSTAAEAQAEVSTKLSALIDALKEKGVAEKDIKTTQISSYPNYKYDNGGNTADGYIANATVTVTIRNITKSQEILDAVTAKNVTNISGPSLTFSDEKLETLKKAAREKAVSNAKSKAQELAAASGANIGKVLTISDSSYTGGMPIPLMAESRDVSSSPSSIIQPGEDEITAQVTVSYQLK